MKTMNMTPEEQKEADLALLALTAVAVRQAEQEWKDLRWQSRKLTLKLVTEHGISVAKAASLSGHTRQTIKIWLDLHNAMQKSAQKEK